MIGYVRNFYGNRTMSFKISDSKLLKKYNQFCKRVEKLLIIKFDSEIVYGDNDKYIKTEKKIYGGTKRKSTMQVFIYNNVRICF